MKRTKLAASLVALLSGFVLAGSLAAAESKGKITAFYPGSTDTYVGAVIKALKEEAASEGFDIEVIENGYFNQQNQDQQVQQYLALGEKPTIFLWWPSEAEGGIGSLRALYNTGVPVLMINSQPTENTKKYIVGQEGPNDPLRADGAAKALIEARQKLVEAGHRLHSEGGNAVALTYPAEYPPTTRRSTRSRRASRDRGSALSASPTKASARPTAIRARRS